MIGRSLAHETSGGHNKGGKWGWYRVTRLVVAALVCSVLAGCSSDDASETSELPSLRPITSRPAGCCPDDLLTNLVSATFVVTGRQATPSP